VYEVADAGDHGEPENTDIEHSETRKRRPGDVFQGKDFTWNGTPPKVARACRENIIMGLPLSVIRVDEKATRTERRLEDKMVAYREIWDKFVGLCKPLYLVGSAVCIDEQLLHSEEDADSGNICQKKQASMESKFG